MKERVRNFAAQMVDADDKHKVHDEIERRIRTKEQQDAVIQHQTELMRIAVYIYPPFCNMERSPSRNAFAALKTDLASARSVVSTFRIR